tara:strand:+ start:160 stop:813 length:654 start_codon:yes stop_codon:yes gene_type:complete
MTRTDIENGVLQILDLDPNTSQRNLVIDPPGQTKYVNRVENDTVATSGAGPITTTSEFDGLAAYLIDNVEDQDNADAALTAAMANAAALAIIVVMDAGTALTASVVNGLIQAETTGPITTIDGGDSTGSLENILRICAGAKYTLPSGSAVEDGANDFTDVAAGSFPEGTFRRTFSSGALLISIGEGELGEYSSSTYEYSGTTGAAVAVYDDDGSLLS